MIERTQTTHRRAQKKTCTQHAQQRDNEDWGIPTRCACYPSRPTYVTAHPNVYTWVGCACRVYPAVFGFSFSAFSGSTLTFT